MPSTEPLLSPAAERLHAIVSRIAAASRAAGHACPARLLAVSKFQPVSAVSELAGAGHLAFGENYVQEGQAKHAQLAALDLDWHLIGPLQSNKCREAATTFDWIESIDRIKLIAPLARFRPQERAGLNLLIQVNVDGETSKSGCAPEAIDALADAIAAQPRLRLRGLMAIPAPLGNVQARRPAFARMRALFEALRKEHPDIDTLSMGMSDDFEIAIAEGATQVRVGTALFGTRPPRSAL